MERTLFLVLAVFGYAVGAAFAAAGSSVVAGIIAAASTASLAVWVIALGVHLGIKDALGDQDEESRIRDAADRWRRSRYDS